MNRTSGIRALVIHEQRPNRRATIDSSPSIVLTLRSRDIIGNNRIIDEKRRVRCFLPNTTSTTRRVTTGYGQIGYNIQITSRIRSTEPDAFRRPSGQHPPALHLDRETRCPSIGFNLKMRFGAHLNASQIIDLWL